jgi:hypothetical protein
VLVDFFQDSSSSDDSDQGDSIEDNKVEDILLMLLKNLGDEENKRRKHRGYTIRRLCLRTAHSATKWP